MSDRRSTESLLELAGRQHAIARKLANAHLSCVPDEIKRRFLDVRAHEVSEVVRDIRELRRAESLSAEDDERALTLQASCGTALVGELAAFDASRRDLADEVPRLGRAVAQEVRDVAFALGADADAGEMFPPLEDEEDFERELVDGGPSFMGSGPGM